jgi:hypothetical protein
VRPWLDEHLTAASGYAQLAERVAGRTFEQGLYRFHDTQSGPLAADLIAAAYPEFTGRATPFAYNWAGHQFALDAARANDGESLILLFTPESGDALKIPYTFTAFHEALNALREQALAESMFRSWATTNPTALPIGKTDCVGYRVPLFLGGADSIENLEVSDIDVYWTITAQLLQRVRGLPQGTRITGVTIGE